MSVSRHPIALRLEQQVGEGTKLLATVMGLPLVDGIFPALIIAGALASPTSIVETGLLIFGGSATVAVILAEIDGTPREIAGSVLLLATVLIPVAAVEAALAETLASVLTFEIFHRFAGLVILTIAAKTASSKVGEYLPSPGAIIALGLVASFDPAGAQFAVTLDTVVIARAVAAVSVGVGFALAVALLGPRLRGAVDIDRFRFGSSVALGMLSLSVLKLMPTDAPVALGVLCVTAVFAFDPSGSDVADGDTNADAPQSPSRDVVDADAPVADGGDDGAGGDHGGESAYGYPGEDGSRAPWL